MITEINIMTFFNGMGMSDYVSKHHKYLEIEKKFGAFVFCAH